MRWTLAQRRFHYDQAFEHYLRENTIPYVAVDEARRALAPMQVSRLARPTNPAEALQAEKSESLCLHRRQESGEIRLKSFDFVVYSQRGDNLLVDVKGRKHSGRSGRSLENWVTQGDVDGLMHWEQLFGKGFTGVFVFLYWCEVQPPDALFLEVFIHQDRWYALLAVKLADYRAVMKSRSQSWGTVCIPAAEFSRLSVPIGSLL